MSPYSPNKSWRSSSPASAWMLPTVTIHPSTATPQNEITSTSESQSSFEAPLSLRSAVDHRASLGDGPGWVDGGGTEGTYSVLLGCRLGQWGRWCRLLGLPGLCAKKGEGQ